MECLVRFFLGDLMCGVGYLWFFSSMVELMVLVMVLELEVVVEGEVENVV